MGGAYHHAALRRLQSLGLPFRCGCDMPRNGFDNSQSVAHGRQSFKIATDRRFTDDGCRIGQSVWGAGTENVPASFS